ncbi:hypothetical protein [Scytonema sp. NUACC26]|uniref:hypothetical protein n=1 Tax=Scytonema sp. NUACC26 TaxID=3140176 RepID=UPI0038B3BC22
MQRSLEAVFKRQVYLKARTETLTICLRIDFKSRILWKIAISWVQLALRDRRSLMAKAVSRSRIFGI